ncbi:putative protease [Streptantibioticus cattleyicolor NRRL 8057 = DSM 46488]|uniref:Tricorn protease homolog n=1 Tax=Streptantibioticus cattleyicolor (strain ATCC 35852 / DSM 46488 / JCM 4925 / NBRC 14057 / NRRL 8057) TaxID=1003195 RepID=F8JWD9_STREN|nr:putative protease [Streptantibioticus cattleyicolor NRRL 8057 = DSM 46488]MYS59155.1 peptidase S41 [Streptomyces sp. SID5468]CCB74869.1 putative tricorn protease homolog 2 [Streptantibioticus cattleyicolor NRRL 8057 = DSM 46488]
MTEGAYLRFPHLHGGLLCFVTEDDLWLAPLAGPGEEPGRAWRVTADRIRLGPPRISPDGSAIAYTSWRSLDPEVHLVPVAGGPARRLTYWGSPDARVCSWTPDGRVLAVSSHGQPFSHYSWAYAVTPDGSPGKRLPWGRVSDIAVADVAGEHRTLILNGTPPHEPAAWKRYRGGATGRLWLHGERLLPGLRGHLDCPMFVGERIAFLSDHEGVGNLYSCRMDGSDLRRHTDHAEFYARNAATDGRRVVYQCAGELWLAEDLADPAGVPRRLAVRLGGPRNGRRPYQVPAAANLTGLACDATGRASAVCVRGSLYWLTHRDGPARTIADQPGARVRLPVMLGDTGRVAFVTDAGGEDAIEIAELPGRAALRLAAGAASPGGTTEASEEAPPTGAPDPGHPVPEPVRGRPGGEPDKGGGAAGGGFAEAFRPPVASGGTRLAQGELGRVHELVSSPDGTTLAVAAHDGRLLLVATGEETTVAGPGEDTVEIAGAPAGTVIELVRSENGPVRDLAFSPDSGWLAWSHPGVGRSLRMIRIARIKNPSDPLVVEVTNGRFEDEQPVFTRDGRYLAFLSWRGFDPVYDVHTGDLSFPLGCRPYLVPLNSATPSPFALPVEGRPVGGGLDPLEGGGGPVVVEAEGLPERVTPFPVPASKYSALSPVRGGLVWLRWPISGALGETFANPADPSPRPTLEFFDLSVSRRTELVRHMDWYAVSGDGGRLVVYDDGELAVVPAGERADEESTVVLDMRRILHEVDPAAEWRQAFDEAGRIVRDYFWSPDMCGIDWPAVLDQYRPLVERVAAPEEFADLLREVLGELGTSHAYCAAARRSEGPAHYQRPIGLLGCNFEQDPDGSWVVGRILPGESSDSRARSPLAGTGVREGSVLTQVDGRPVDPHRGPYPLLAGAGGTTVELTFTRPRDAAGGNGHPRRVAVVPLIDDRPLRYQDWVARRRSVVRELSQGRCGYLHIPDMGGSGWAQFNRDLRLEVTRPALIVDVRGNAGGNISELVIEKLTRTILGWDLTRDAQPVSYTANAPRGPIVAVADDATSSDGDMIIAAFRLLGLGPVIGTRTWGGVVGMTGRHRLIDGTVITVPMNAAWFDEYGWRVENEGVEPDVEASRTPLDWAEGRSSVLAVAVRTALDLLRSRPPATPPDLSGRPDRRRPPLPPRG